MATSLYTLALVNAPEVISVNTSLYEFKFIPSLILLLLLYSFSSTCIGTSIATSSFKLLLSPL